MTHLQTQLLLADASHEPGKCDDNPVELFSQCPYTLLTVFASASVPVKGPRGFDGKSVQL